MTDIAIPLSELRKLWRQAEYDWDIDYAYGSATDLWRRYVREEVARRTIAELRAQVEQLTAELAEREVWKPLPDSTEYFEARGLCYRIFANGEGFAIGMEQGGGHFKWPDNVRVCGRTSSANATESE